MKNFIEKRRNGLKLLFRAFSYRNYRLYFAGHGISLLGTWMQRVAVNWLVYRLTGSVAILGMVAFVSQISNFVVSPFAGVMIDRISRRRVILVTQILATLQAVALAALTLTNTIQIWHIFVLAFFFGLVRSVDSPARNVFVVEMVERKENLGSAIALNAAMFNIARLVGPSIAGILLALTGEGVCFLANAVTYLAIIGCLLAMQLEPRVNNKKPAPVLRDLKEGIGYAYSWGPIRSILLLISFIAIVGLPYLTLMPVMAKDVLGGSSSTYGFLMGAVGIGAVAGALFLGTRKSFVGLWKVIPVATGIFGTSIVIFSFSRNMYLSLAMMAFAGFGQMVQFASCNTVLQNIVDDDKRGRVMSLYTMSLLGLLPFGQLLMATGLAENIGAPLTLLIGGCGVILSAVVFSTQLGHFRKIAPHSQRD